MITFIIRAWDSSDMKGRSPVRVEHDPMYEPDNAPVIITLFDDRQITIDRADWDSLVAGIRRS